MADEHESSGESPVQEGAEEAESPADSERPDSGKAAKRLEGPWQTRVSFAPGGGLAYRPGEVVARKADIDEIQRILGEIAGSQRHLAEDDRFAADEVVGSFVRFSGVADPLGTVRKIIQAGLYAQVNHVMFAHADEGLSANPFYANPFYANPFYANPFYANPFYANPFYANPFYANPFYANPNPAVDPTVMETGRRPSSARPTRRSDPEKIDVVGTPRIVILDTGYAKAGTRFKEVLKPPGLEGGSDRVDVPDFDSMGYLDPAAGHGTFIAGVIEQLVPGCSITVKKVLSTYGDGDEVLVGQVLHDLAVGGGAEGLLVNLSFGGYSTSGMGVLASAVAELHNAGATIVASAGNDATSLPMYPAVLPYVLAVGALDHEEQPAPFSNYGPWVRACAEGVEIESTFFSFRGDHPAQAGTDIDNFGGWAVWSGTSFAAPRVVAALAQHMRSAGGGDARRAVRELIDAPGLDRKPLLGTVVRPG